MRKVYYLVCLAGIRFSLMWAQEERQRQLGALEQPAVSEPRRPKTIVLRGKVLSENGEPLPGAYIRIEGTIQGAVAGANGEFRLNLLSPMDPILLEASFVGYEASRLSIPLSQVEKEITLTLKETGVRTQEVVISASRVSETVMNSPVTVLKMNSREVQEAPGLNIFQNITIFKSAEQVSSSLTFQIINTRGFNSSNNTRFVQRLDGIEIQAPVLNFPVSGITNTGDLDVESVEIVPGPASALYGPNAFNGIMNVYTKDPFRFPGLSASVRLGLNHPDRVDTTPQPLYDISIRYAKSWKNRIGFKIFANWFDGHDWVASSRADVGVYVGARGQYAIPGPENPGYQGLNVYGDEIRISPATVRTIASQGSLLLGSPPNPNDLDFYVSRTGYLERDLVDYRASVKKALVGGYYRITDKLQLKYLGYLSTGSTVYQGNNRYSLRDFIFSANALELSGPDFRIWAYNLWEDAGESYDSRFAAINLLRRVKPDNNWMVQYVWAYTGQLYNYLKNAIGLNPDEYGIPRGGSHAEARRFADSDRMEALIPIFQQFGAEPLASLARGGSRLIPGTPAFREALRSIASNPNFLGGGAGFFDRSSMYHAEGQYDLSRYLRWVSILVGGNFRYFLTNSRGTVLADTAGPIGIWEVGAFIQASRAFWRERLRLTASLRYDRNKNFTGRLNPRIGGILALDPKNQHNLRLSYQTGFRMPTLQGQYIDLNLGAFRLIGGLPEMLSYYGLDRQAYTLASVRAMQDSIRAQTRGTSDPNAYADLLRPAQFPRLSPELVSCVEVGSRHLLGEKIYIDLDYAYSWYTNFIGQVDVVGARRITRADGSTGFTNLTPTNLLLTDSHQVLRVYQNTTTLVAAHHFSAALQYTLNRRLFLNANFTYAEVVLTEEARRDQLIARFNTPRYKANVYLTGREFLTNRRLGFSIGYRWINAYLFEESFHSQVIPTYQLVDAQISYKFPKLRSLIRMGGQNILNNRHIELPGGPTLGALYYVQWVYDPFLP
ncbi:MAG: TonB-dependent receptor [Bacteroidia bacterium]|nr:TonB-dependent receptor [Bacteroidia bacterium]MDW8088759.1 TonB-dependent receptor [Bacteroidia bacterium]